MTTPEEPRKTVFSFNERGFDFDAVDIGGGDALITIRRGNETVRELKFPAYKVYNIAAHANDIVDGLLEESDRGLQIAGSDGLGGEAMTPPDELTPETLRAVFHALWHSRMLVPGPTEEDCLAHVSAWAADRRDAALEKRDKLQRAEESVVLRARIEALENEAATLHAALMVFEAGWSTGGYLDPLDFWDKCFPRLNDLVPPEHRSFVWAVEQEMRDRAPLRGEEER